MLFLLFINENTAIGIDYFLQYSVMNVPSPHLNWASK